MEPFFTPLPPHFPFDPRSSLPFLHSPFFPLWTSHFFWRTIQSPPLKCPNPSSRLRSPSPTASMKAPPPSFPSRTPACPTCSLTSGPAGPVRSSSRCLPGGARRRGGRGWGWGSSAARCAPSSRRAAGGGGCGRSRQRLRFISAAGPRGRQHRDCPGPARLGAAAPTRQPPPAATMARRAQEATDPSSQLRRAFWGLKRRGLLHSPYRGRSIATFSSSPIRHTLGRPPAATAAGSTASCLPASVGSGPAPPLPAAPPSSLPSSPFPYPPQARAHGERARLPPLAARSLPRTRRRTVAGDPPVAPLCGGESGRGRSSWGAAAAADAH